MEAYYDGFRDGTDHAWQHAGLGDEFPNEESLSAEEMAERLEQASERGEGQALRIESLFLTMHEQLVGEALGYWHGFAAFVNDDLGLDPEAIVGSLAPGIFDEIATLAGQPDPERMAEYRQYLLRHAQEGGWSP